MYNILLAKLNNERIFIMEQLLPELVDEIISHDLYVGNLLKMTSKTFRDMLADKKNALDDRPYISRNFHNLTASYGWRVLRMNKRQKIKFANALQLLCEHERDGVLSMQNADIMTVVRALTNVNGIGRIDIKKLYLHDTFYDTLHLFVYIMSGCGDPKIGCMVDVICQYMYDKYTTQYE